MVKTLRRVGLVMLVALFLPVVGVQAASAAPAEKCERDQNPSTAEAQPVGDGSVSLWVYRTTCSSSGVWWQLRVKANYSSGKTDFAVALKWGSRCGVAEGSSAGYHPSIAIGDSWYSPLLAAGRTVGTRKWAAIHTSYASGLGYDGVTTCI